MILFENSEFLILDKPAGFTVHNEKPSLAESLAAKGFVAFHWVNRLDRETSGLVVAAKSPGAVAALTEALKTGRKLYRAVVKSPRPSETPQPDIWVWNQPVSDKAEGRRDPYGRVSDRIPAESRVKRLQHNDWFWDLEIELMTGRQHQIRKHAAGGGVPIVGDPRYGREALNSKITENYGVTRMMLHAWKLELTWQGQSFHFEAPLPAEFAKLISAN